MLRPEVAPQPEGSERVARAAGEAALGQVLPNSDFRSPDLDLAEEVSSEPVRPELITEENRWDY